MSVEVEGPEDMVSVEVDPYMVEPEDMASVVVAQLEAEIAPRHNQRLLLVEHLRDEIEAERLAAERQPTQPQVPPPKRLLEAVPPPKRLLEASPKVTGPLVPTQPLEPPPKRLRVVRPPAPPPAPPPPPPPPPPMPPAPPPAPTPCAAAPVPEEEPRIVAVCSADGSPLTEEMLRAIQKRIDERGRIVSQRMAGAHMFLVRMSTGPQAARVANKLDGQTLKGLGVTISTKLYGENSWPPGMQPPDVSVPVPLQTHHVPRHMSGDNRKGGVRHRRS